MEFGEEEIFVPASPASQYFNNSVLSIALLGVLELEVPIHIDDSQIMSLIYDMLLPLNPRFSSIMVETKKGVKLWKKVEVNLKDHLRIPKFPVGESPKVYDQYFNDYLTKISLERLLEDRPLWEIHVIKYPTTNAAGAIVFKLHHALGDGYTLMGALLSCLQKADNPNMPLPLPTVKVRTEKPGNLFQRVAKIFPIAINSASDFFWGLSKSTFAADDKSPVYSGDKGIEFRPISIVSAEFPLPTIKEIKAQLGVTINDVVSGAIFYGVRLYMKEMDPKSTKSKTTSLVLLNTRMLRNYITVEEMVQPKSKNPWGNHFAFLSISVPKLSGKEPSDPLSFVWKAQKIIKKKRNSLAVILTGKLLDLIRTTRGLKAAAKFVHGTLTNTGLAISNLVGPTEQAAIANHPCKGMYFVIVNAPQSLTIMALSYMDTLRITIAAEKDFIDSQKLKACIEKAFQEICLASSTHDHVSGV
ncbi:hypothetical protein ACFE04_019173 [Oxalis oulophora]